jgi:hypothetical protein
VNDADHRSHRLPDRILIDRTGEHVTDDVLAVVDLADNPAYRRRARSKQRQTYYLLTEATAIRLTAALIHALYLHEPKMVAELAQLLAQKGHPDD